MNASTRLRSSEPSHAAPRDKCDLVVRDAVGRRRMRPVVAELDTGQQFHRLCHDVRSRPSTNTSGKGQGKCSSCLEDRRQSARQLGDADLEGVSVRPYSTRCVQEEQCLLLIPRFPLRDVRFTPAREHLPVDTPRIVSFLIPTQREEVSVTSGPGFLEAVLSAFPLLLKSDGANLGVDDKFPADTYFNAHLDDAKGKRR